MAAFIKMAFIVPFYAVLTAQLGFADSDKYNRLARIEDAGGTIEFSENSQGRVILKVHDKYGDRQIGLKDGYDERQLANLQGIFGGFFDKISSYAGENPKKTCGLLYVPERAVQGSVTHPWPMISLIWKARYVQGALRSAMLTEAGFEALALAPAVTGVGILGFSLGAMCTEKLELNNKAKKFINENTKKLAASRETFSMAINSPREYWNLYDMIESHRERVERADYLNNVYSSAEPEVAR